MPSKRHRPEELIGNFATDRHLVAGANLNDVAVGTSDSGTSTV